MEQKVAMKAVLQCHTDMVAVMATGSGKSMLAIVPSLLKKAMATVLVLPLNSLIMDYRHHLNEMCVPYQVYGGESTEDCQLDVVNNLIIVSADKA